MSNVDRKIFERPFPRVKLHPATLKHLRKGHPWVTSDSFTKDFPRDRTFLLGLDGKEEEASLLLHDPDHPKVKGRLWSMQGDFIQQIKGFPYELRTRMGSSIKKRQKLIESEERENICLVFGENDFIPGLHITLLKDQILVQLYAGYWHRMKLVIIEEFQRALEDLDLKLNLKDFWFQDRNLGRAAKFERYALSGKKRTIKDQSIVLQEFGVQYKCKIAANYDLGLYTDMAPFRKKIGTEFNEKKVLNLYSYTGAFSLYALKAGAQEVVSVDLSQEYLNWLQENLDLNPDLDQTKHKSICMSVEKAMKLLVKQKSSFDWIISDPPSASSDGKKMSNALKNYERLLPEMLGLLSDNGKIALFLNTHQVSPKKFRTDIEKILTEGKTGHTILSTFKNLEDGQSIGSFPEGHHLKGFIIGRQPKGSK